MSTIAQPFPSETQSLQSSASINPARCYPINLYKHNNRSKEHGWRVCWKKYLHNWGKTFKTKWDNSLHEFLLLIKLCNSSYNAMPSLWINCAFLFLASAFQTFHGKILETKICFCFNIYYKQFIGFKYVCELGNFKKSILLSASFICLSGCSH